MWRLLPGRSLQHASARFPGIATPYLGCVDGPRCLGRSDSLLHNGWRLDWSTAYPRNYASREGAMAAAWLERSRRILSEMAATPFRRGSTRYILSSCGGICV